MNKKLLLFFIVITLIILVTGTYLLFLRDTIPPEKISTPDKQSTNETQPIISEAGVEPTVFEGDLRDLPTSPSFESKPFTGDKSEIKIVVSNNLYVKDETIEIKIKNNSSSPLQFINGPGCNAITYERKADGKWDSQIVHVDTSRRPCRTIEVEPNKETVILETINSNPPAGIYRATFLDTIHSNEFIVSK